jgi:hypothetical protein
MLPSPPVKVAFLDCILKSLPLETLEFSSAQSFRLLETSQEVGDLPGFF